jgi:hypothetical protein
VRLLIQHGSRLNLYMNHLIQPFILLIPYINFLIQPFDLRIMMLFSKLRVINQQTLGVPLLTFFEKKWICLYSTGIFSFFTLQKMSNEIPAISNRRALSKKGGKLNTHIFSFFQ